MHVLRKICAAAALWALAFAPLSAVHAQNIISVGGPVTDLYLLNGTGGEGYAASWSQTDSYDNASISALLGNETGLDATGTAYLTTALGSSATTADLVSSQNFTIPAAAGYSGEEVSLFSGLNLNANQTYYLVLNVDQASTFEIGWDGSQPPVVNTGPGVTYGWDYLTGLTLDNPSGNEYPYNSQWSVSSLYGDPPNDHFGLEYTVQGDPVVPVTPESSSLALILPSGLLLAGLALFARRRKGLQS